MTDEEFVRRLRSNCFAVIATLLVQCGLGMWVNLYGHLPASDHGASIPAGFARAVSVGPIGLSVHAVVGVLLLSSSATALVRAIRTGRAVVIGAAVVALGAIIAAGVNGARFVGSMSTSASMTMAIAAAMAIIAYALILLQPPQRVASPHRAGRNGG